MMLSISTTKFFIAETSSGHYNSHRRTCKTSDYYLMNSKQTCKPLELHTIIKFNQTSMPYLHNTILYKCNGTGLVLKMCETKNNVWKKCEISIQDSIDSYIETTKIKPNFASLNNGLKCRKPVFMWVSGICFIDWS